MMIIKNREIYYSQPFVLYNLIPQLKFRYLSAKKSDTDGKMVLVRYYMGYELELLKDSLRRLGAYKDISVKLYADLSKWEKDGKMPLFSFNMNQREKDKEKFNDSFEKYFSNYPFAIDIDCDDDIMKSWEDTKKIKELFEEYKLPYSLKFSGGRGFHFLIDEKWFSDKMKPQNKVILFGRVANVIMNVCGLKSHDKGGTFDDSIYDSRRIFKLAYSLVYKGGKEYVCLPLSDEQFESFKLEDMELEKVSKSVTFFKRGLLERNYGLTEKELKRNVVLFLKEVGNGKSR